MAITKPKLNKTIPALNQLALGFRSRIDDIKKRMKNIVMENIIRSDIKLKIFAKLSPFINIAFQPSI